MYGGGFRVAWRRSFTLGKVRSYSRPGAKLYEEEHDRCCFKAVLHVALRRLSCKMWHQISKGMPLGESYLQFYKAVAGPEFTGKEYTELFSVLSLDLGQQFEPANEFKPNPELSKLAVDLAEKKKKAEGKDLEVLTVFLKDAICRAEMALFAGQPNIRELQQNARTVASHRNLDPYPLSELKYIQAPIVGFAQEKVDLGPLPGCVTDDLLMLCEDILIRGKVVADAGGLPLFGNLVPLFRFEFPHSYRIVETLKLSGTKSKKSRSLEARWTKGSEGDTIVLRAEGAQSKQDVRVERTERALRVSCQDKSRTLAFPAGTRLEQTRVVFDEAFGLLTVTVPKKLASDRVTAFGVAVH